MVGKAAGSDPINEIVSHSQSLAQCRSWLDGHYPGVARTPVSSNGEAAQLVAENPGKAAIAGEIPMRRLGLPG